ncbi:MAG: class I SAM-dependent methyltransferase [Hyphomicrobiaceae bacterium]
MKTSPLGEPAVLDALQLAVLNRFSPPPVDEREAAYAHKSKLRTLLGESWVASLEGLVVADFGCGHGYECVELATVAGKVIGVDIEANARLLAQQRTAQLPNVVITDRLTEPVDAIVSLDAFEHFADPEMILRLMSDALAPGGRILASFGPTWYHPLGGHFFSVFPWSHLIFSEQALLRWRQRYRPDRPKRLSDVEGGLNRMTIARFERMVSASGLKVASFDPVPIRRLRWLHSRLTREFTTAIVRVILVKA